MFSAEDVLCQERGSQSSIAAARNGCGSVISVCASNTAIAEAQNAQRVPSHDSVQGATGRKKVLFSFIPVCIISYSAVYLEVILLHRSSHLTVENGIDVASCVPN